MYALIILSISASAEELALPLVSRLQYRKPDSVAVSRLVACGSEVVGMGAFLFIQWTRPSETPWHAMSVALMLLIVYLYIPNRLVYATAIASAATAAFLAMMLAQEILLPYELLTMTMLLVLANSFGFIAARKGRRFKLQLTVIMCRGAHTAQSVELSQQTYEKAKWNR